MPDLLPLPYLGQAVDLLPLPLTHLAAVTAHPTDADPFPLDYVPDTLRVTFAENWAPYAQVELSLPVPSEAVMGLLDPRKNCRLSITAGYEYPDGRQDVHPLAEVGLRERLVGRPANLVTLKAASDEARTQDYRIMWHANFPRTGINEAVSWLLAYALAPSAPVLVSPVPDGSLAGQIAEIEAGPGDDVWSILDDIAARTGSRIWCNEAGIWHLSARTDDAGPTALDLTVGKNGTIITSDASLSRESWYNAALLRYRWTDAGNTERIVYGRARANTGPYSVHEAGSKTYFEEIERPATQAGADRAAESRLRNLFTRGRALTLRAAAAYWLRPGMTISVQLPTGEPELHLVQSVTFNPHLGVMDVSTRQPLSSTITNGE